MKQYYTTLVCFYDIEINLLHNDVTCPKGSMGVVVLSSNPRWQPVVCNLFRDSASVLFELSESSNKSPKPLLNGPATSEHTCLLALLQFKFPTLGKYDAILDSFMTSTPTMHIRAAKALFDVIMHKVYYMTLVWLFVMILKMKNKKLGKKTPPITFSTQLPQLFQLFNILSMLQYLFCRRCLNSK